LKLSGVDRETLQLHYDVIIDCHSNSSTLKDMKHYLKDAADVKTIPDVLLRTMESGEGAWKFGLSDHRSDNVKKTAKIKKLVESGKRYMREIQYFRANRIWMNFVKFCIYEEDIDPISSKSQHVVKFVSSVLQSRNSTELQDILNTSVNFFTSNAHELVDLLASYLDNPSETGSLVKDTDEFKTLLKRCETVDNCTDGVLDEKGVLIPSVWYNVYGSKGHSKSFWRHTLVRKVLHDVKSKVLDVEAAAWLFKLPTSMIMAGLSRSGVSQDTNFSLKQYQDKSYGSEEDFWEEMSNVELVEKVRNRELSARSVAVTLGVSLKRLMEEVKEVKTEEQLKMEKQEIYIENVKRKREGTKDPTDSPYFLQEQEIKRLESSASLSDYEMVRLENMRERLEMMKSLNIHEDKKALSNDTDNAKIHGPVDYGTREKSSRIKKIQEEKENDLNTSIFSRRRSPLWTDKYFASKSTDNNNTKSMHKQFMKSVSQIPLPSVSLDVKEVLSVGQNYQRSKKFLECVVNEVGVLQIDDPGKIKPNLDCNIQVERSFRVSDSQIVSVNSVGDFVCFGDASGNVGLKLDEESILFQPHQDEVSRTLFIGDESDLSIASSSLDGRIRYTNLSTSQVTCVYQEKEGIQWLESFDSNSLLVNIGGVSVGILDKRKGDLNIIVENFENKYRVKSNIGLHPSKSKLSICGDKTIFIYDTRKTNTVLDKIDEHSSTACLGSQLFSYFSGSGWSCGSGSLFLGCKIGKAKSSFPLIWRDEPGYSALSLELNSIPMVSKKTSIVHPCSPPSYRGAVWCPWVEEVFFVSAGSFYDGGTNIVVGVDALSGEVVCRLTGDLSCVPCVLECHPSRPEIIVANSAGQGFMAKFNIGT